MLLLVLWLHLVQFLQLALQHRAAPSCEHLGRLFCLLGEILLQLSNLLLIDCYLSGALPTQFDCFFPLFLNFLFQCFDSVLQFCHRLFVLGSLGLASGFLLEVLLLELSELALKLLYLLLCLVKLALQLDHCQVYRVRICLH